jgi:histone H3/H4
MADAALPIATIERLARDTRDAFGLVSKAEYDAFRSA